MPWTPTPLLPPRTPTHHQGSSRQEPDFKTPPTVDYSTPPPARNPYLLLIIPIFGHKTLVFIVNPRITNQKVKLLPFRFPPVHTAGRKNVAPDCLEKQTDTTKAFPI